MNLPCTTHTLAHLGALSGQILIGRVRRQPGSYSRQNLAAGEENLEVLALALGAHERRYRHHLRARQRFVRLFWGTSKSTRKADIKLSGKWEFKLPWRKAGLLNLSR